MEKVVNEIGVPAAVLAVKPTRCTLALAVLAGVGFGLISNADASIVSPENLAGVIATAGYTESWYVTGSDLPSNQSPATIAAWLSSTLGLPAATTVSSCDSCNPVNNTATLSTGPADVFAVHFGQNELVFEYPSNITSFTIDLGNQQGLSNIRSFEVPLAVTPLPGALALFGGGLGMLGLLTRRKKRPASVFGA